MTDQIVGRALFACGLFIFLALFTFQAIAKDSIKIVGMKKQLTLNNDDVEFRDYYLAGGTANGLKKDTVYPVYRFIDVRESDQTRQFEPIKVPVGQLKIIYVQDTMSIARESKIFDRDDLPVLDNLKMMRGDWIVSSEAIVPRKKSRKTASTSAKKEGAAHESPKKGLSGKDYKQLSMELLQ